jgi:DNA modification methylase
MNISLIKPYEKNAKKHPAKQIKQVAASIREFGFNQPIVLDKNNVIIVGHGRFEAAKLLKLEDVPTLTVDLSEEKANAYRLADNKLNESEWDMKLAIEELKGMSEEMLDLTGFDKDLIIEPNAKDDECPEPPKEPQSQLGDIYELGGHRILCGDSTKLEDIERLMTGIKADAVVTDPPYNVDYEGATKDKLKIENDKKDDGEFKQFLIDAFAGMIAYLKPGGVFYIWHADSEGYNFRAACHEVGMKIRQCLIWNKNVAVMGRQDYHWKHEPCLYGWKDGSAHLWNSDRKQNTILNFDRPQRNGEHPTMKPVELLAYLITNNTKGEDIILDTFIGSGSTLIAAEKTGRYCYGIELDPKYVDVIVERYCDYTGHNKIIKNGEIIVWQKKADLAK